MTWAKIKTIKRIDNSRTLFEIELSPAGRKQTNDVQFLAVNLCFTSAKEVVAFLIHPSISLVPSRINIEISWITDNVGCAGKCITRWNVELIYV